MLSTYQYIPGTNPLLKSANIYHFLPVYERKYIQDKFSAGIAIERIMDGEWL